MTIGLLPAAGEALRIHGLPKWMLPTSDGYLLECHVTAMSAVCSDVLIGSNPDNYGLLCQYAPLKAHVYRPRQYATMTQTVLGARDSEYQDETFVLGMPDTVFDYEDVYRKLAHTVSASPYSPQVAVAAFYARSGQHTQGGMLRVEDTGRVTEVIDKPDETDLAWIWGALAWQPAFWEYMHPDDPHVGYALPRAIAAGLDVRAVVCDGDFWDCGTPEHYFEMIRALTGERETI